MATKERYLIILECHGLFQLIRLNPDRGQLFPRASQVFVGLLKIGLEHISPSLCLGGLGPGFLLGAFEVRYLPPRFILFGAELVQLAWDPDEDD